MTKYYLFTALFAIACPVAAQPTMTPLDYEFRQPSEWRFVSGQVLQISYEPRVRTALTQSDTTVAEIRYPEVIAQIVSSPGRRSLLALVNRYRGSGAYDYAYLMTVTETSSGRFEVKKRLQSGSAPMAQKRWVVEPGAISDDATTALIKVGEPSQAQAPFIVGKVWETWNLSSETLLRVGLTICE